MGEAIQGNGGGCGPAGARLTGLPRVRGTRRAFVGSRRDSYRDGGRGGLRTALEKDGLAPGPADAFPKGTPARAGRRCGHPKGCPPKGVGPSGGGRAANHDHISKGMTRLRLPHPNEQPRPKVFTGFSTVPDRHACGRQTKKAIARPPACRYILADRTFAAIPTADGSRTRGMNGHAFGRRKN